MAVLEKISDIELGKIHTLGYFLGSFDPLHQGHIEVVEIILKEKLCDCVFVYCVNGQGTYKQRSDFIERTKMCEFHFGNRKNVLISYMNPIEIQKKLVYEKGGLSFPKFVKKITGIFGSDIAIKLERPNKDENLEKIRMQRQKDFMRGYILSDDSDSISCSICLPAADFIVALRNNNSSDEIPDTVCDRKVRAIINTNKHRFVSSSKIRA